MDKKDNFSFSLEIEKASNGFIIRTTYDPYEPKTYVCEEFNELNKLIKELYDKRKDTVDKSREERLRKIGYVKVGEQN